MNHSSVGQPADDAATKRVKNLNIFFLGLAFLLMYTAFQTLNGIEQTVLDSYHHLNPNTPPVNGLISIGIFYFVNAISCWIAPSIITLIGPKGAMVRVHCF